MDENGKPNTNVVVRSRDEAKLKAAMVQVEAMLANLKVEVMAERFSRPSRRESPPPECQDAGPRYHRDLDAHTVELSFDGKPEFANPIGIVQGGFLSAMLDDTWVLLRRPR
jgi:hypothetical protein